MAEISKGKIQMGRGLVIAGLVIASVGLVLLLGFPIGRLPGDLTIRRGNLTFYLPLASSILVSVMLTLIFTMFGRK